MPIINIVYKTHSWSQLKSYYEIVTMATTEWYPRTNTIAELNADPENYYNMLSDWWYLFREQETDSIFEYVRFITWIEFQGGKYTEWIYYYNNIWNIWQYIW